MYSFINLIRVVSARTSPRKPCLLWPSALLFLIGRREQTILARFPSQAIVSQVAARNPVRGSPWMDKRNRSSDRLAEDGAPNLLDDLLLRL